MLRLLLVFLLLPSLLFAQKVTNLTTGTKTHIRGLSVVNNKVVWVSGSNGMVGKSLNEGKDWTWMQVPGYEKREFRDIEAFDSSTAIIMAVAEPAIILRTADGGQNWQPVYDNDRKGMFLDAMDFYDSRFGLVLGDPVDGRFFMAETRDSGKTWQDLAPGRLPIADSGEACFAASGTNIRMIDTSRYFFVSGGRRSRVYDGMKFFEMPMVQGRESTGANSIAIRKLGDRHNLVVVGGDFAADTVSTNNSALSGDGGKTWSSPATPPGGYRSSVEYIGKQMLLACGLSGVDISRNEGKNWINISKEGFHVCRKAKSGRSIFLAGSNGRVAKLEW